MDIRVFGPLTVRVGDAVKGPADLGGAKPRQVLQLLVLARGGLVTKDALVEALWPRSAPDDPFAALRTHVSVLRRHLGPEPDRRRLLVQSAPGGYRLRSSARVDLFAFEELLVGAATESGTARLELLERAVRLARGEVFEDEPYAAWAEPARRRSRDQLLDARLALSEGWLGEGRADRALRHAEAALQVDQVAEAAWRAVMRAQHALGRGEVARRALDRCRQVLAVELGIEPDDETVRAATCPPRRPPAPAAATRPAAAVAPGGAAAIPGPAPDPPAGSPWPPPGTAPPASPWPPPAAYPSPAGPLAHAGGVPTGPIDRPAAPVRAAGADRRRDQGVLPLLGRDAELDALVELATAGHGARLAVVSAPPGMGRTALLAELGRRLASDGNVGTARYAPYHAAFPEPPLSSALRGALGLEEAGGRWPHEPADLGRHLAHLLRARGPVVLLLDDLHHADAGTGEAIAALRAHHPGLPVAVVATVDARSAGSAAAVAAADLHVPLRPLAAADVAGHHAGLVPLVRRCGGDPGLLADQWRWLQAGRDGWSPSVEARVKRQLWELGQDLAAVLRAVATVPPPLDPAALPDALAARPADHVREALVRLLDLGVLRATDGGLAFAQPLVRDVLAGPQLAPCRPAPPAAGPRRGSDPAGAPRRGSDPAGGQRQGGQRRNATRPTRA